LPLDKEEKNEFTNIYFRVYYFYSVRLFFADDRFEATQNTT
jgi:hypothetical protein